MNKEEIDNIYKVLKEQWGDTDNYINDLLNYSKDLQQENQKYKEVIDKAIEFTNKNWGTWCTHHLEYMTELQDILKGVK